MNRTLIMALGIIAGSLHGTLACKAKGRERETRRSVINTQRNGVGIAADDVCYLSRNKKMIRCRSGRTFKNPIMKESALTGTPGFLSGSDYIGYVVSEPSTPSLMGSGKRIDLYER